MRNDKSLTSLRGVAVFEAAKGLLVLAAAGMFVNLLHADAQGAVEQLVRHFHLDPARHNPRVFVDAIVQFGDAHLLMLSLGALLYASVRFAEAYGLWRGRAWAWGFGLLSATLYLPFEMAELTQKFSWAAIVVLLINVGVIIALWLGRQPSGRPL